MPPKNTPVPSPLPPSEATKPINLSDFEGEQSPANLAPAPVDTATAGMLGELQSQTDTFTENLTKTREAREKTKETSRTSLMDELRAIRGESQLTSEAYKEGGVNAVESELNDINQQIRAEQRALENRLRTIEESGGGLAGGAASEIANARRESLRTQADLYVIQQGVQGRYDSAKAIADRAVDAYLEQQQQRLDVLKFDYQENKDLFTTAEQREFETLQADRRQALETEAENKKAINNFALEALKSGASPAVAQQIMGAKSLGEAIKLGGSYFAPKGSSTKWELKEVNGKSVLFDPATGTIKEVDAVPTVTNPTIINRATQEVKNLNDISNSAGLESAVGPNKFARISPLEAFTAQRSNFVAAVNNVVADLVVGNLIEKKAEGATFGALNEQEFGTIKDSATKINQWAITDPETKKVVGYQTTEDEFKKEWDKIQYFSNLDALLKGADPAEIGVEVTDDGKYWMTNSSGDLVEIKASI